MIDRATVDKIYATANIVDVVGDFVTLRKKGVNYQCCCPFHNEKTPSFVVSPSKGLYKCFGCGKGGNAVTFVMEHEGLTYPEALKWVAKKYGIAVEERELTPEEERKNDDRESMMVVSSWASDYFRDTLQKTDEGRSVGLSYLRSRGMTDATIEKFCLGYSPEQADAFSKAAIAAGYKEEYLTATGLTIKRETGGYYDRFHGRVMFPIHSISGRVTGFGGRTMRTDKNVAKYLNSPESEIYHKSSILYGLYFAKKAITQDDCCILVEGYTDVISMHQAGVENVVASSGTSLTEDQIRLIARFTRNVTVIYDGDPAGIKASLRGIDMILREGLHVRVVLLPEGEDPDSFARAHSATELKTYIREREEDFLSFKTRVLLDDTKGDPLKKASLINDIVQSIAEIPDPVIRSVYIKECARKMDVDEALLTSEVARKRLSYRSDPETAEFVRRQQAVQSMRPEPTLLEVSVTAGSSMDELEKELVKYLLRYGDKDFEVKEGKNYVSLNVARTIITELQVIGVELRNPRYQALYTTYKEQFELLETEKLNSGDGPGGSESTEAQDEPAAGVPAHLFINHPDPGAANAAVDILTSDDNYIASRMWQKHDVAVGTEEDRLSTAVPRAVILYKSKAIELIIGQLQAQLQDESLTDEQLADIMLRIDALNRERMSISKKVQRLVL
ncbi:MAG: DNA primase [Rikenellaceae bacterium]|jgi:DNA primase|nr:DNA primase [Rikenellaceae bacterium]